MKNMKLLFSAGLFNCFLIDGECSVPFAKEAGFSEKQVQINSNISSIDGINYRDVGSKSDNVYVLFFSTAWCHSCPKVATSLSKLASAVSMNNKNVKFLYITIGNESNADVKKHFDDLKVKGVEVCQAMPCTKLSGIECVPSCIVFDKYGKQVFRYDGSNDYNCYEFKNFLIKLAGDNSKKV